MKIIVTAALFALLGSNYGNENCNGLKIGKYKLLSEDGTTHIITRTEKSQTEKIIELGSVFEFDILWSNSCEYKLFNRRVITGTDRFPNMKIDTLFCKIIEASGNMHTTETSIAGSDFTVTAQLEKVE